MIQKRKNWLIKKLGGYTQREYDIAVLGPVPPVIKMYDAEIEKLSCAAEIPYDCDDAMMEYLKKKLCRRLGEQLELYTEFHITPSGILRGSLRVIKKERT